MKPLGGNRSGSELNKGREGGVASGKALQEVVVSLGGGKAHTYLGRGGICLMRGRREGGACNEDALYRYSVRAPEGGF